MKKLFVMLLPLVASCSYMQPGPCPTAREAMAAKGTVLDCWHDQMEDTYERVDRCLVILPGQHRAVAKIVFPRHCGL